MATVSTRTPSSSAVTNQVGRVVQASRAGRAGRVSRSKRHIALVAGLAALAVVLVVLRALASELLIPIPQAVDILRGARVPGASFILMESTLPRALLGAAVGAAFGLAGATFQTVLRNPLASPDMVGVGMGASAAAVLGIVVFSLSGPALSVTAMAGALGVAVIVRVVSGGRGERLILTGVGVAAVLGSVIHYLFTRAEVWDAQLILRWLTGSVSNADWPTISWFAPSLAALGLLLWWAARDLGVIELGDDLSTGLGARRHSGDILLLVGVALVALAVAAVGPMAFVAFMSGPIARALNHGRGSLLAAALVGANVVVGADYLGAHLIPGVNLPAGVVSGVAGAPVLLWLMLRGRSIGSSS